MNEEEQGKKMSRLIARCWADEGFKRKLLADATATLKAEGEELPAGLTFKAVENTDKVFHLVIPAKPTELSDEDLDRVTGGEMCVPGPGECYGPEGKEGRKYPSGGVGGSYKLYGGGGSY